MTYVPVFCDACGRGSLSLAKDGVHALFCSFCEGPTRAVPGPAYGDGDWLAFAEIDRAVFEAGLNASEAALQTAELQAMLDRGDPFTQITSRMLERIPALLAARPALMNQPARGVRMLATALTARMRDDTAAPLRAG
jgi:hypothetical protein